MLNYREAAKHIAERLERTSFPESTIRSWVHLGWLPSVKVGRRTFVKVADLENFLPDEFKSNPQVGCK